MSDDGLPSGWYEQDDGTKKYWDGDGWVTPSAPPGVRERGRLRRRWVWTAAVLTVLLALAGAGLRLKHVQDERAQEDTRLAEVAAAREARESAAAEKVAEEERKEAAAKRRRETAEEERRDEAAHKARKLAVVDDYMTSGEGGPAWTVVESGNTYYRFGEDSEYTCGRWSCIAIAVVSVEGCSGGTYIEAAIENEDGAVVGWTNVRIGATGPDQVGMDLLEDTSDDGATFRVTEVNCRN